MKQTVVATQCCALTVLFLLVAQEGHPAEDEGKSDSLALEAPLPQCFVSSTLFTETDCIAHLIRWYAVWLHGTHRQTQRDTETHRETQSHHLGAVRRHRWVGRCTTVEMDPLPLMPLWASCCCLPTS